MERLTVEAYLEWEATQTERHELVQGEIDDHRALLSLFDGVDFGQNLVSAAG